jgi:hypothetical protein
MINCFVDRLLISYCLSPRYRKFFMSKQSIYLLLIKNQKESLASVRSSLDPFFFYSDSIADQNRFKENKYISIL